MQLGELLDAILDYLRAHICVPFGADGSFTAGFLWAVIIGIVGFLAFRFISPLVKRVRTFFSPTPQPMTQPGTSPFSRFMGCAGGSMVLAVIILSLVIVLLMIWERLF